MFHYILGKLCVLFHGLTHKINVAYFMILKLNDNAECYKVESAKVWPFQDWNNHDQAPLNFIFAK